MESLSTSDLKYLALSRSIIYDYLASSYIYPYRLSDFERLIKSRIDRVRGAIKVVGSLYPSTSILSDLLNEASRVNDYDSLTRIETDFTRVDYGAIPYEGYTHTGYLDVRVEYSLRKLYADYNLVVNKDFRDLRGDHIAVELAFMSYLAYKEYEDPANAINYADEEDYFLNNHLITWVPIFVKTALKLVKTDYFKYLLEFTRDFINEDKRVIKLVRDAYGGS
ncbi:TorD/DmsD family molecular chaperone [Vulcanisaeta thermophila]|uniref:TorD/DmsD family molecular chaperone n=1 Tax=Vulcanisaeta thermophila TaxID=867917 RepID=UPI000853349E|nr:molecular chaperone TorD family protein [Vulcanisaeta thermophila]